MKGAYIPSILKAFKTLEQLPWWQIGAQHEERLFKPLKKLLSYMSRKDRARVRRAFFFAQQAHHKQKRLSGDPYITHPVAVSGLVAELKFDADTIIAALLHDVIEDTGQTKERITEQFGEEVSALVDGVSKLDKIAFSNANDAQKATFQKMMMAMTKDIRVMIIKLADRIHNSETLELFEPSKRRRIGQETLDIYAPLASKFGIYSWSYLLEQRSFEAVNPWRYRIITEALRRIRTSRRSTIDKLTQYITKELLERDIKADVKGREKSAYSVHCKMQEQHLGLDEILDLFACRVIVKNRDDCYRTLGVLHSLFKPVPGRIKDYIALPKPNGYQSLHTILLAPQNAHVEVQIRSELMHVNAEYGIAAHWLYKQKGSAIPEGNSDWLASLTTTTGDTSFNDFMDSVRHDLSPPGVYVFTPNGEILSLPRGATALDFAYAVHTDVGNQCAACEIDRQRAPIDQQLFSGQTVHILTSSFATPSPNWLNFAVTAKAQLQIRQYLRSQTENDLVNLGRQMVNSSLSRYDTSLENISKQNITNLVEDLKKPDFDAVLLDVGQGKRPHQLVAMQLLKLLPDNNIGGHTHQNPLIIAGSEKMAISLGKCCHPIPNDKIMGNLTAKGIVVHRLKCTNARKYRKKPDRWISLNWGDSEELSKTLLCSAILNITTLSSESLLDITNILHSRNMHIRSLQTESTAEYSQLQLEVQVHDRMQLASVMRKLRTISGVDRVHRA